MVGRALDRTKTLNSAPPQRAATLRSSRLWLWSILIAIPLAVAQVVRIAGAFVESTSRGWEAVEAVALGAVIVVIIVILMAVIFGLPRAMRFRFVRARSAGTVILCRRALDLPEGLRIHLGRSVLAAGSDEFFVMAVESNALNLYRIHGEPNAIATLAADDLEAVDLGEAAFYVGRRNAITVTLAGAPGGAFSFLPYRRPYPLGTIAMPPGEIKGISDLLRNWRRHVD